VTDERFAPARRFDGFGRAVAPDFGLDATVVGELAAVARVTRQSTA
jgi:hypothetical protein